MTAVEAELDRLEVFDLDKRVYELPDARGSGARRGEAGMGDWRIRHDPRDDWGAEIRPYPTCSEHGAMNRVGVDPSFWRCLVEGCNIGCELVTEEAVEEAEAVLREEDEGIRFFENHEKPPPDPRNRFVKPPGARSASWDMRGELIDIEWENEDDQA